MLTDKPISQLCVATAVLVLSLTTFDAHALNLGQVFSGAGAVGRGMYEAENRQLQLERARLQEERARLQNEVIRLEQEKLLIQNQNPNQPNNLLDSVLVTKQATETKSVFRCIYQTNTGYRFNLPIRVGCPQSVLYDQKINLVYFK